MTRAAPFGLRKVVVLSRVLRNDGRVTLPRFRRGGGTRMRTGSGSPATVSRLITRHETVT